MGREGLEVETFGDSSDDSVDSGVEQSSSGKENLQVDKNNAGDSNNKRKGEGTTPMSQKIPRTASSMKLNKGSSSKTASSKRVSLKTPTHINTNSVNDGAASTGSMSNTAGSGGKSIKNMDVHPYARGSIIEVYNTIRALGGHKTIRENIEGKNSTSTPEISLLLEDTTDLNDENDLVAVPWLCDIIDRAPLEELPSKKNSAQRILHEDGDFFGDGDEEDENDDYHSDDDDILGNTTDDYKTCLPQVDRHTGIVKNRPHTVLGVPWRYYVHYRDFNRRMDEWVTADRIVSPPSVGAAKARSLAAERKREEQEKRRKQEEQERNRLQEQQQQQQLLSQQDGTDEDTPAPATRLTRRQKRKSTEGTDISRQVSTTGIPVLTPGTANVVATVPAEELDEHEGLDESALREHEEVTKVKNVGQVELGPHRMSTWYFSPLPKELMTNGFIPILYVCEFTLNFFTRKIELIRFQKKLPTVMRHPPGNEIYRNGNLSSK